MVFKICDRISCYLFYVREFGVIGHKTYFPCITLSNFWPFCTPNHWLILWLEWELGIVTKTYCLSGKTNVLLFRVIGAVVCYTKMSFWRNFRCTGRTKISQKWRYSRFSDAHRCYTYLSWVIYFTDAWIHNYIHDKVWDEITYPLPKFHGAAVEIWEWKK